MNEERIIREFEQRYKNLTLLEFSKIEDIFKLEYSKVYSNKIRKRWRELINTFPIAEYKKEKIWMFLNNDISKEKFDYFVEVVHRNWLK